MIEGGPGAGPRGLVRRLGEPPGGHCRPGRRDPRMLAASMAGRGGERLPREGREPPPSPPHGHLAPELASSMASAIRRTSSGDVMPAMRHPAPVRESHHRLCLSFTWVQ